MTHPRQPIGWRITQQTPGMGRMANGPYVQGVNIMFALDNGLSGTVFVPNDQYNPQTVRDAIQIAAQRMNEIHQLSGQV